MVKPILKYKKHPSILAIGTICNRNEAFSFKEVSFKEIETEIGQLKLNITSQYSDLKLSRKTQDISQLSRCAIIKIYFLEVFDALLTDLSKAFDCLNHAFDSKIKRIWSLR